MIRAALVAALVALAPVLSSACDTYYVELDETGASASKPDLKL